MLNETFYLDGVDAATVGIKLQSPVEFSEAVPVLEPQTIPGRNGDLVFETGAYENRSASAECFCLQEDVEKALSGASRFLMAKRGYRRLETSDDPDHFWLAVVENSPQIAMRIRMLAPFSIGFDCKPQRFCKSGESVVEFLSDGTIENETGFDAKPIVTVYGSGSGELYIGGYTIRFLDILEEVTVDCEAENAYNVDGNQNRNIFVDKFPVLVDGVNTVSFSGGIERVEIIPRWWTL